MPVGPITRAQTKGIKEASIGLVQELWEDQTNKGFTKETLKEDPMLLNMIQLRGQEFTIVNNQPLDKLGNNYFLAISVVVSYHLCYYF